MHEYCGIILLTSNIPFLTRPRPLPYRLFISPSSQPRALIGGHVIGGLVGLLFKYGIVLLTYALLFFPYISPLFFPYISPLSFLLTPISLTTLLLPLPLPLSLSPHFRYSSTCAVAACACVLCGAYILPCIFPVWVLVLPMWVQLCSPSGCTLWCPAPLQFWSRCC